MPIYHTLGKIPHKRHTAFRKADGSLYYEQLFGTEGFSGMSALLYHEHRPTQVKKADEPRNIKPEVAIEHNLKAYRLEGFQVEPKDDYLESRTPVLVNQDCYIELAAPRKSMTDYFYKNVDADEVVFIHKGEGTMHTLMGDIDFAYGDYIVVPRGIIYQMEFKSEENRLLIVQSFSPVYTPKRYRNNFGQFMEHSPFCERDFRRPEYVAPKDQEGEFLIKIKKQDILHGFTYATHPFDVVGWDGYNYPYAFSIHDFEPITGRVHLPPPIHQTFEAANFVICSFCPRLYDYHPEAIPAPYNHSNIDSDEVLYYVDGDFMSRNDIEAGHITIHPAGVPHGPHPGAAERSIGKKETEELAVMIDTFKPLKLTKQAMGIADDTYWKSWVG